MAYQLNKGEENKNGEKIMVVFYLLGILVLGVALYITLNLISIKKFKFELKIN